MKYILLLVTVLQTGIGITYNAMDKKPFTIQFPAGAAEACTVYHSLFETIVEDGKTVPYEPKHCWFFASNKETSYQDDWNFIEKNGHSWDVHADIFYDVIEHGGSSVKMISTDIIRVEH